MTIKNQGKLPIGQPPVKSEKARAALIAGKVQPYWIVEQDGQADRINVGMIHIPSGYPEGPPLEGPIDWHLFGALAVTEQGDAVVLVHGLRRLRLAIASGYSEAIPVLMFSSVPPQKPADTGTAPNGKEGNRPLSAFFADLNRGDPEAVAITAIVQSIGRRISWTSGKERVACIDTLQTLFRASPSTLQVALRVAHRIQATDTLQATLLSAMFRLELYAAPGFSLAQDQWAHRLVRAGYPVCKVAMEKAETYHGMSGPGPRAMGLLAIINKRKLGGVRFQVLDGMLHGEPATPNGATNDE